MKKFKVFLEEYEKKINLFCDMDGVLTDINEAFKKLSGKNLTLDNYIEKYGDNQAWDLIHDAGVDFWENMPWTKDGKKLWYYIKKYNPKILSSPSSDESSVIGKIKWLKRNIPEVDPENYITNFKKMNGHRTILNPSKFTAITKSNTIKHLAGEIKTRERRGDDVSDLKNKLHKLKKLFILIDDTPKKINDWNDAGGIGILHTSTSDTINRLKEII